MGATGVPVLLRFGKSPVALELSFVLAPEPKRSPAHKDTFRIEQFGFGPST